MTQECPLTRIVLASASPRRFELLRSLGLQVEAVASGYHEPDLPGVTPRQLAAAHAHEKLSASLAAASRAVPLAVPVVAADTVVDLDGIALGKPVDRADAARMLRLLSGREHRVHTAFALAVPGRDAPVEEVSTTRVRFYALEDEEIAAYVATGEPLDKAGAYGIQGRASALVEGIDGDFYTVMGFPLARFVRALRRLGFSLPTAKPTAP
ncbi:MAG: Maf family protein [Candidatus Tumulicola sp.]